MSVESQWTPDLVSAEGEVADVDSCEEVEGRTAEGVLRWEEMVTESWNGRCWRVMFRPGSEPAYRPSSSVQMACKAGS